MGGDQQVHGSHPPAGFFQKGTDLSVGMGGTFIVRQDLQGQQELSQGRPVLFAVGAVFHAEPELGGGDGRKAHRADGLDGETTGHLRVFAVDEKNAVVGIQ